MHEINIDNNYITCVVVPGIYMAVILPIGFLVGSKNNYLYYVNNDLIA